VVDLYAARKIGLVLSGGSSRCAFQVGVIERLFALGIRPSLCIGVSAGVWNAAMVAAHAEERLRFFWKTFMRMPHVDLRNLLIEQSPWRFAAMLRRNYARFIDAGLAAPVALPLFISVTRLRDGAGVILDAHTVANRADLLIAANYLPPFYTRSPLVDGERYGDGGVSDNAPYEKAFAEGCDAVILVAMKGESEGGIFKSANDVDHVIERDDVVVIRPRHRLPYSFTERRWTKVAALMTLGDLRTREILLGESHPETDVRAKGDAPSTVVARAAKRMWALVNP
jgi:predicted acylesterase/phospholipase RssA